MQHSLELDSVLKTFGDYQLLTDIYLRIQTGDIIGLFGRNGTGKTVLLNILFGTMKADRKFIRLNESKVLNKPFTHNGLICYLPQQPFIPKELKVEKAIVTFLGKDKSEVFFEDDDLAIYTRKLRFKDLSGGERRYLEVKLLLLKECKFLLLDEPFNFMAPVMVEHISDLIRQHATGKGIIITDHDYNHVLNLVNRTMILKEGALKELTDPRGLIEQGYINYLT